jgi:hypothetical protein
VHFNKDDFSSIETVSAVSELFSVRLKDLRDFGRPVSGPSVRDARLFEWLTVEGHLSSWDDTSIRAMISFLKYEHQATTAFIHSDHDGVTLTLEGVREDCAAGLPTDRNVVSFWARISAIPTEHPNVWILERLPYGQ